MLKTWSCILILALLIAVPVLWTGRPALAAQPTDYTATVATDDGINLKERFLPNGNAAVMEMLPKGVSLEVLGAAVMNTITVNVPQSTPTDAFVPLLGVGDSVSQPAIQTSGAPIGFLDMFDPVGCAVGGWALDPAHPTDVLTLEVAREAAPGAPGAVPLGNIQTTLARPDVNTAHNVTGAHGFLIRFSNPIQGLLDGNAHPIFIDAVTATSVTPLNGSGAPLTCNPQTTVQSSSPVVIDQVWLYIKHPLGSGFVRGWVNARYVEVKKATDTQPRLWTDYLKKLPVIDPATQGRAVGVKLPPLPGSTDSVASAASAGSADTVGATSGVDFARAKTVYVVNLDPGANLSIHKLPDVNSPRIAVVPLGTALTVCGRAGDVNGNLWLCVYVNTPHGQQRGFAISTFLSTDVNQASAADASAQVQATPTDASAPAVQPAAAVVTAEPTQVVVQPVDAATPEPSQVAVQADLPADNLTPAPTAQAGQ